LSDIVTMISGVTKFPSLFSICSKIPNSTDKHYLLADVDHQINAENFSKNCWIIETSPARFHVMNFAWKASFSALVNGLEFLCCDPAFIRATKKNGFAQLNPHGLILQKGVLPDLVRIIKIVP
jgi:hypothetical protein